MQSSEWLIRLFESIDSRDTGRFLGFLAPDVTFRFGNMPPVSGQQAVGVAVQGFFDSVKGLRHGLFDTWSGPESVVCRGEVTYTRHDGSTLTVPFANVLQLRGSLISDYQIYVDISPLFAAS